MTDHSVPRDQWGRPRLYPPDSDKRVGYTRVSTLAKALDDKSGLVDWKASMAIMGVAKNKSLQARVASINAKGGGYHAHKGALREIVGKATDLAGSTDAADFGTSLHDFTELIDASDLDFRDVPEDLKGPLNAYAERMVDVAVLDTEVFGTVDAVTESGEVLRAAGSMDRIVSFQGEVLVGDLKTGASEPKYPMGVSTQIALYAHAERYSDDVFEGSPRFEGFVDPNGISVRAPLADDLSLEHGLLIHLPLNKVGGKWVCDLYLLDIRAGWNCAMLGVDVREAKKFKRLVKL